AKKTGEYGVDFPFFSLSSMRYQQVYDAGQFAPLTAPALIIEISYRPDFHDSAFKCIIPSIQINLSTTSVAVGGMSTTFANNVGLDDTLVYKGKAALIVKRTGSAVNKADNRRSPCTNLQPVTGPVSRKRRLRSGVSARNTSPLANGGCGTTG